MGDKIDLINFWPDFPPLYQSQQIPKYLMVLKTTLSDFPVVNSCVLPNCRLLCSISLKLRLTSQNLEFESILGVGGRNLLVISLHIAHDKSKTVKSVTLCSQVCGLSHFLYLLRFKTKTFGVYQALAVVPFSQLQEGFHSTVLKTFCSLILYLCFHITMHNSA